MKVVRSGVKPTTLKDVAKKPYDQNFVTAILGLNSMENLKFLSLSPIIIP
jgi:hypothetical protein